MSSDYLLGKDIATIQESLRRLEFRLDASERGKTCKCSDTSPTMCPQLLGVATEVIATESGPEQTPETTTITIHWRATDITNSRRVPSPDRKADFVYFGVMIPKGSYPLAELSATALAEGRRLFNLDMSAPPSYYFRPTGIVDWQCLMGIYNGTDDRYGWLVADFNRTWPDGSCCILNAQKNDGSTLFKSGWEPSQTWRDGGRYRVTLAYCDCDNERGIGFSFSPVVMA